MKKMLILLFISCITTLLVLAGWTLYTDLYHEYVLDITGYQAHIRLVSENDIYDLKNFNSFNSQSIQNKTVQDILINKDSYRVLMFYYEYANISSETVVYNDYFLPKLNNKKFTVLAYEENVGIAIPMGPKEKNIFRQDILIKTNGLTDAEIIQEVKNIKVLLKYRIEKYSNFKQRKVFELNV